MVIVAPPTDLQDFAQHTENKIARFFGLPHVPVTVHVDTEHDANWRGRTHMREGTIEITLPRTENIRPSTTLSQQRRSVRRRVRELLVHETLHLTGIFHNPATRAAGYWSRGNLHEELHPPYIVNIAEKIFGQELYE